MLNEHLVCNLLVSIIVGYHGDAAQPGWRERCEIGTEEAVRPHQMETHIFISNFHENNK